MKLVKLQFTILDDNDNPEYQIERVYPADPPDRLNSLGTRIADLYLSISKDLLDVSNRTYLGDRNEA